VERAVSAGAEEVEELMVSPQHTLVLVGMVAFFFTGKN
jgi:hypothetical protein